MQKIGELYPGRSTDQKRWLVCGGRTYGQFPPKGRNDPLYPERKAQRLHLVGTLERLAFERSCLYNPDDVWLPSDIFIITGGASGADEQAIEWAIVNWCEFKEYPAKWTEHGKAAGFIRNKQMLVEGKPDLVIAFPGGRGTAMMVKLAQDAGVETIVVPYEKT